MHPENKTVRSLSRLDWFGLRREPMQMAEVLGIKGFAFSGVVDKVMLYK
jgi:hypothetical protein